ncbi:MAG: TetR/AcrR family transcriptional regulator [Alphaproteobacteria bacterium]|nr:TetR/AcrR family transcriptional regulator [Alphaproteobacteria bacterium]
MSTGQKKRGASQRTNDPERTKRDIVTVATHEFAENGLSGARVDEIAARTKTSKRMIYYYFGSKEGLYLAVLEEAYRHIRNIEGELKVDHLSPDEGLAQLVRSTFDYHLANPDFARLVMNENMHRGEFIGQSTIIQKLNLPAIQSVRSLYERGRKADVFRDGIDPVELHWTISALCLFNVSNRYTFSIIFKRDLGSAPVLAARRQTAVETILSFVRK